jgi:hypothetical protein
MIAHARPYEYAKEGSCRVSCVCRVEPSMGIRLISGSENCANWSLKTADEKSR